SDPGGSRPADDVITPKGAACSSPAPRAWRWVGGSWGPWQRPSRTATSVRAAADARSLAEHQHGELGQARDRPGRPWRVGLGMDGIARAPPARIDACGKVRPQVTRLAAWRGGGHTWFSSMSWRRRLEMPQNAEAGEREAGHEAAADRPSKSGTG